MAATYASVLAVSIASLAIGQAALALCGRRRWSWSAPAVGLALLVALCWATVRLPGDGTISALAVLAAVIASAAYLWGRVEGVGAAARDGLPVGLAALVGGSIAFVKEGHFGILGTSFNPDMSQHLLAADRLAHGESSQLLAQGYPLGPHSIVVALNKGLGVGLVHGFSGLTVAVTVLTALTALGALGKLAPVRRWIGALLVGAAYMLASYFAQGAFKETLQALFILAFAIELWHLEPGGGRLTDQAWTPLRAVPLALLAVGSIYTYSFPGLTWLAGALVIWAVARFALGARPRSWRPWVYAGLVFVVLVAPELGRMLDFRNFETFDPNGPGLGNLFGQISPFEALGIWPSGDFRLTPGAGAVPSVAFYAGAAFALVLLLYGIGRSLRRREIAFSAALAAALIGYAGARIGGTPYTTAKAVAMISPLAALLIVRELFDFEPVRLTDTAETKLGTVIRPLAAAGFIAAAGICSTLALANAPVGPTSYSPQLTGLRPAIASGSTLVLAPEGLLRDQHGTPYIAWELRGGRVCIKALEPKPLAGGPRGIRFVVTFGDSVGPAQLRGFRVLRRAGPYLLWEHRRPLPGPGPCPLIAVRQARQGNRPTG
jgi:hypothetical protein